MLTYSHLVLLIAVFSFMVTAVNLLPAVVRHFQDRYKGRFGGMTRELDKFFVHLKITHIMGAALAGGVLIGWLSDSWVLGASLGLAAIFSPRIVLAIWKSMRSTQFEAQLMDALILINNAMRSGLDIATGIELVSTNMAAPISEEFGIVLNTYRLGGSLETALQDMTKRIRSRPLETVVGAIVIQRETGGNLIKTFEQLVQTIREESKLQKKVKALSAQGRTQIAFLAFFPWGMAALFYFLSPDMMQPALANSWGQMALVGLLVWEVIGIVVTKRIVTVDV